MVKNLNLVKYDYSSDGFEASIKMSFRFWFQKKKKNSPNVEWKKLLNKSYWVALIPPVGILELSIMCRVLFSFWLCRDFIFISFIFVLQDSWNNRSGNPRESHLLHFLYYGWWMGWYSWRDCNAEATNYISLKEFHFGKDCKGQGRGHGFGKSWFQHWRILYTIVFSTLLKDFMYNYTL